MWRDHRPRSDDGFPGCPPDGTERYRDGSFVDQIRVFQNGVGAYPLGIVAVTLQLSVEARLASRVAGNAAVLRNGKQQDISVAVKADYVHAWRGASSLSLAPWFLARARPVNGIAGAHGFLQRLRVHPGDHKNTPAFGVLRDGGDQAVIVELYVSYPGRG